MDAMIGSSKGRRNRRNRVTPFGRLEVSTSRGMFLGNRGDLHAKDGSIRKAHAVKFWICCTLEEVNGKPVIFDKPGNYTPLFFWDEAVALAAGHRPCGRCRKDALKSYKAAINRSKGLDANLFLSVEQIDAEMHNSRLDSEGQRKFRSNAQSLPSGTFICFPEEPGIPVLLWDGLAYPWSHDGYAHGHPFDPKAEVDVLTPRFSVDVLAAGYRPTVRLEPCSR